MPEVVVNTSPLQYSLARRFARRLNLSLIGNLGLLLSVLKLAQES
jgi:predicted nucleic acid-binding protein